MRSRLTFVQIINLKINTKKKKSVRIRSRRAITRTIQMITGTRHIRLLRLRSTIRRRQIRLATLVYKHNENMNINNKNKNNHNKNTNTNQKNHNDDNHINRMKNMDHIKKNNPNNKTKKQKDHNDTHEKEEESYD